MGSWVVWKSWLACAEPFWEFWPQKGPLMNSFEGLPLSYYCVFVFNLFALGWWGFLEKAQENSLLETILSWQGWNKCLSGSFHCCLPALFFLYPWIKNLWVKKVQTVPMADFILCLSLLGLCRPDLKSTVALLPHARFFSRKSIYVILAL